MSFKAQEWAYGLRDLTGPEKAVLNCLAWHHNQKTGLCCPGNQLIAEETCLGLSTVKKALASLILKGLISRYPWRGRSAYMLAITEPEVAPTEPPLKEQESNYKERRVLDSDWRKKVPEPVGGRELAQVRIARTRELNAPVEKPGTPEERQAFVERMLRGLKGSQEGDCYGQPEGDYRPTPSQKGVSIPAMSTKPSPM